jgi:hypothetical protein
MDLKPPHLVIALRNANRVRVSRLNALKFLQCGCKNGERGRRAKARRRATQRKLREPSENENDRIRVPRKEALPACPDIESRARFHTKKEVLLTEGS